MSFETYKIAVAISLTENVTRGLAGLSSHFKGTELNAAALQKRLDAIGKMTLGGGLLAGAGVLGLKALHAPYEEAKKLLQAKADLETLNLSKEDNASAYAKAATNAHKVLGTTLTENIKQIHDLHTVFGDMHHAVGASESFAKYASIVSAQNHGKPVDRLVIDTAKALEHRGGAVVGDEAVMRAELEYINKVTMATKGVVTGQAFLGASKSGKMAYQMYDKEYLYGNFAGLMSINGGDRMGTEGMTAFSSLIGGHMDGKAKGFLADIGLYQEGFSKKRMKLVTAALKGLSGEEKQVAVASLGGQTALSGGLSDAHTELMSKRPDIFINDVLAPAVRKRFGMDLSDAQVAAILAKNFNRATGNFLGTQVTMRSKLDKDTKVINNTMGLDAAQEHYLKTAAGSEKALHAAWVNLKTVVGVELVPNIVAGINMLAGALRTLGEFFTEHPYVTKGLMAIALGLSVLAVAVGGVLLSKAAGSAFALVKLSGSLAGMTVSSVAAATATTALSFALKVGLIGALGFAVVEVFRLVDAFLQLKNANKHKEEADAQAEKLKAYINSLSPADRAKYDAMDKDKNSVSPALQAARLKELQDQLKQGKTVTEIDLSNVRAPLPTGGMRNTGDPAFYASQAMVNNAKQRMGLQPHLNQTIQNITHGDANTDLSRSSALIANDYTQSITKTLVNNHSKRVLATTNNSLVNNAKSLQMTETAIRNSQISHQVNTAHSFTTNNTNNSGSPYIMQRNERPMQVTVVSKLDGREIARSTANYMSTEAARPMAGSSYFDPIMHPQPIGMSRPRGGQ